MTICRSIVPVPHDKVDDFDPWGFDVINLVAEGMERSAKEAGRGSRVGNIRFLGWMSDEQQTAALGAHYEPETLAGLSVAHYEADFGQPSDEPRAYWAPNDEGITEPTAKWVSVQSTEEPK